MKVISVIEDDEVIKKILKHLGLWDRKARPPPKQAPLQKTHEYRIDYSESQLPEFTRHHSGGSDKWLYVDPVYPEDSISIDGDKN